MDMGLWYENRKTYASFSILNLTKTPLNNIATGTAPASVVVVSGGATCHWTNVLRSDRRRNCERRQVCQRPLIFEAVSA